MPAKLDRKQSRRAAARKPAKPRRAPNGRFKGQPRTLSETVMPEELAAPATEAPRECAPAAHKPSSHKVGSLHIELSDPDLQEIIAEAMGAAASRRPWYRRLWEWLR